MKHKKTYTEGEGLKNLYFPMTDDKQVYFFTCMFTLFTLIECIFFCTFTLFALIADAFVGSWSDWQLQAVLFNCLSAMQNSVFRRHRFTNKSSV